MTTIELKSKTETYTATIPDNWGELSMKVYLEMLKEENLTDIKFLSLLSGIAVENLNRCETKPMLWLIMQLRKQFSQELLTELSNEQLLQFEFKGVNYCVCKDLGTGTYGEYESLIKVETMLSKNQWHLFPLFLAMLYRPHDETYDHDTCNERAEQFIELPVTMFYRARGFFLNLQMLSESGMQASGQMSPTL